MIPGGPNNFDPTVRPGPFTGNLRGYQMLGSVVKDPEGTEAKPGNTPGLSLLPVETVLKAPKTTTLSRFRWDNIQGTGYEIHMGQSILTDGAPLFQMIERNGTPSRARTDADRSGEMSWGLTCTVCSTLRP